MATRGDGTGHTGDYDAGQPRGSTSPEKKSERNDDKRPAWSELKTKAGKERKRLPLACIACRRKKIRCSGEKPACKHCLRSRTPCVYKVTTRKAAPRTDYMTMLDKRLKRMEERVIKIVPDAEADKMASIGRASVKPPAVLTPRSTAGKKRIADEAFSTDIDKWARDEAQDDELQRAANEHTENRLSTDGAEHLPPKALQEHLAETFFDNCYGQAYYLLHKPSFMRRLNSGTVPPVLTLAVCAIAARFSTHPDVSTDPPFLRGEQWAKPARDIVLKRYDEPNITVLIVLMILCLHEFGTCQGGRSWMLGGMAIRMAASLQLHREVEHDPLSHRQDKSNKLNITDREIRRRAMWSCFMMDRFISSGTERPMVLDEESIEIQLPIEESRFQMELPGITERLDGCVIPGTVVKEEDDDDDDNKPQNNMGVAAYLVRTIALWGRVVRYLNLGGKQRDPHPMWHTESKFMELKKQAADLHRSFPDRLKFTSENLRTHSAKATGNQFLFLHISYQTIVLFLHKFAIPTRPNTFPARGMPREFVQMAGRAAIESAGKISELLSDATAHLLMAPFAGYCAFLSSTVHVWGIFSKNSQLGATSKRNLATNVKYLSQMKKVWGVLYHMSENLRTIYRQFADAPAVDSKATNKDSDSPDSYKVLDYGGWFKEYPHGVSQSDYQEPAESGTQVGGNDAALSQKSDLQTVQEFFETPAIAPVPQPRRRKPGTAPATRRQPQRTQQQAGQPSPSSSTFPTVKTDGSWSNVSVPVAQSPYANMPRSAYAVPGHPLPTQSFRRPSHPPSRNVPQRHYSPLEQPPQRPRASFDAVPSGLRTSPPQVHTSNLESYHAGGAGGVPMYSPPGFPSPHSTTVTNFPNTPFFGGTGGGSSSQMPMSLHDMDRQMVYGAYATDAIVTNDPWGFGAVGFDGSNIGGDAQAVISDPAPGGGHDVSGIKPGGAESVGDDVNSIVGLSGDASAAWFLPFNIDVGLDTFDVSEYSTGDALGDGARGSGDDAADG